MVAKAGIYLVMEEYDFWKRFWVGFGDDLCVVLRCGAAGGKLQLRVCIATWWWTEEFELCVVFCNRKTCNLIRFSPSPSVQCVIECLVVDVFGATNLDLVFLDVSDGDGRL